MRIEYFTGAILMKMATFTWLSNEETRNEIIENELLENWVATMEEFFEFKSVSKNDLLKLLKKNRGDREG